MKWKLKGFTLTEILIVVVIIGVLTSMSLWLGGGTLQRSHNRQCELNLKLLRAAVIQYTYDYDALPGTLGEVWPEYRERAIAQLMEEGVDFGRQEGFIQRLVSRFLGGSAEAQEVPPLRAYGVDITVLTCPSDKTPPPGGFSYGINAAVAGEHISALNDLGEEDLLIAECDHDTFTSETEIEPRHRDKVFGPKHGNAITKGGKVKGKKGK